MAAIVRLFPRLVWESEICYNKSFLSLFQENKM